MMKQLEGEFRNGQLCAIVPFPEFIELVRKAYGDAKLKRIVQPVGTQPQPVIIPPLAEPSEFQLIENDVDIWQATGKLPSFVAPWLGDDEGRFD